jgi:hypothetical protein
MLLMYVAGMAISSHLTKRSAKLRASRSTMLLVICPARGMCMSDKTGPCAEADRAPSKEAT